MRQPRPHRAGLAAVLLPGTSIGFASAPFANAPVRSEGPAATEE